VWSSRGSLRAIPHCSTFVAGRIPFLNGCQKDCFRRPGNPMSKGVGESHLWPFYRSPGFAGQTRTQGRRPESTGCARNFTPRPGKPSRSGTRPAIAGLLSRWRSAARLPALSAHCLLREHPISQSKLHPPTDEAPVRRGLYFMAADFPSPHSGELRPRPGREEMVCQPIQANIPATGADPAELPSPPSLMRASACLPICYREG